MKKLFYISLFVLEIQIVFAQFSKTDMDKALYEASYQELTCMLQDSCEYSFTKAVFITENAFFNNTLNYYQFQKEISKLTILINKIVETNELLYDLPDKDKVAKHAAIFRVMMDSIPMQLGNSEIVYHTPYTYDFNDIWGRDDWSSMFVVKLLDTKKGNCHSLPYLYKILSEQVGADAYIALAPNHFYIKCKNQKNGWYNTELTSKIFPIDAWIMASGYVHLDAIVNKLYMEALDNNQSIALCLMDLAQGYEKRFGFNGGSFQMQCIEKALEYYPHFINALLLKAEIKRKQFFNEMDKQGVEHPSEVKGEKATQLLTEMEELYLQIHLLGYRQMPEEMYLEWLISLKEEKEKYQNKRITNFNVNPSSIGK